MRKYKSLFEKGYYTNLSHYELFERPNNLVSVEEYFRNPFVYPLEVHALTEIIYRDKCGSNDNLYKNWFQTLETSRIDVVSIVPTQKFLLRNKLENWEERPITIYPEFIKSGDYYYLLDGHHRVAKWIEQGVETIEGKVIDVQNPFSSLEVKPYKSIYEDIKIPLEIGDEIKTGKFKNKKAIVKGFGTDDKNQPVVKTSKGDQSMFKFRISKLMPENTNDYAGEHSAPNKSSGAPMHDLSEMYPDDIYSSNAVQYYGDGLPYDGIATAIISYAKNRPNAQVKIYRSVPDINYEVSKQIKEIKDIIKYFDKFNFFPMKNSTVNKLESEYPVNKYGYDGQHEKIYEILELTLSQLEKAKNKPLKLNSGDWVTIVKQYAIEHGKAHLGNKFKLLSKTVPAKHLYSQGDSIHEWGYSP